MSSRPAQNTFGNLISPEDAKSYNQLQNTRNVSDVGSNINTVVSQARYINYQNVNVGLMNTNDLMEYPCELPQSESKSKTSRTQSHQFNFTGNTLEVPEGKFGSNRPKSSFGGASRFHSAAKSHHSSARAGHSASKSRTSFVNYSQIDGTQADPILLLDINLPNGDIERFVLHKNDDVDDVVDTFVYNNSEFTKFEFRFSIYHVRF